MPRKSNGITPTTRRKKITTPVEPGAVTAVPELQTDKVTPITVAAGTIAVSLDEEIRRRAYELYLLRNGQPGDPNRDWFVAEREVRARHATAGHSA